MWVCSRAVTSRRVSSRARLSVRVAYSLRLCATQACQLSSQCYIFVTLTVCLVLYITSVYVFPKYIDIESAFVILVANLRICLAKLNLCVGEVFRYLLKLPLSNYLIHVIDIYIPSMGLVAKLNIILFSPHKINNL